MQDKNTSQFLFPETAPAVHYLIRLLDTSLALLASLSSSLQLTYSGITKKSALVPWQRRARMSLTEMRGCSAFVSIHIRKSLTSAFV
jgi:hypothetical protein